MVRLAMVSAVARLALLCYSDHIWLEGGRGSLNDVLVGSWARGFHDDLGEYTCCWYIPAPDGRFPKEIQRFFPYLCLWVVSR
jgi:hypothetical protein